MTQTFHGIKQLYGKSSFEKIQSACFCVIGIGGVGSWSAESLARSGAKKIILVDLDEICLSNINRQVHAHSQNIGRSKVEEMASRLLKINPEIQITKIEDFYTESSSEKILSHKIDYLIDAIDNYRLKAHLISECKKKDIPMVTIGAAGGKRDPSFITSKDLAFSINDTLLARVRRLLRTDYHFSRFRRMKFKIASVYSTELAPDLPPQREEGKLNCNGLLGSSSIVTASMGLKATQIAIESVIDDTH